MHDYRDAEEVIRIGDIMEQYPNEIQKMLPCNTVNRIGNGDLIKNEVLSLFNVVKYPHFEREKIHCNKIVKKAAAKLF